VRAALAAAGPLRRRRRRGRGEPGGLPCSGALGALGERLRRRALVGGARWRGAGRSRAREACRAGRLPGPAKRSPGRRRPFAVGSRTRAVSPLAGPAARARGRPGSRAPAGARHCRRPAGASSRVAAEDPRSRPVVHAAEQRMAPGGDEAENAARRDQSQEDHKNLRRRAVQVSTARREVPARPRQALRGLQSHPRAPNSPGPRVNRDQIRVVELEPAGQRSVKTGVDQLERWWRRGESGTHAASGRVTPEEMTSMRTATPESRTAAQVSLAARLERRITEGLARHGWP